MNKISFYFFFSSRRRHTRWNCDWSSDVCSSDLRYELLRFLLSSLRTYLSDTCPCSMLARCGRRRVGLFSFFLKLFDERVKRRWPLGEAISARPSHSRQATPCESRILTFLDGP